MNNVYQLREEMKAADKRAEARINSMKPGYTPVQPGSVANLVAGIGGAAISGYATYEQAEARRESRAASRARVNKSPTSQCVMGYSELSGSEYFFIRWPETSQLAPSLSPQRAAFQLDLPRGALLAQGHSCVPSHPHSCTVPSLPHA